MKWIVISLDYCDRESYKKWKGADKFDCVIENIRRLLRMRGQATVGLSFLLWRENYTRVDDMIRLGKGLGVDYVQFRPMVEFDLQYPNYPKNIEWIDPAIEILSRYAFDVGVIVDLDRFKMLRDWQSQPYSKCYWAQLQTIVTPDGSVWTCCNRRGFPDAKFGNLHDESFIDIWKRSRAWEVDDMCRVMCRGVIPNLALAQMMSNDEEHRNFI